jgi:hypothetical protein
MTVSVADVDRGYLLGQFPESAKRPVIPWRHLIEVLPYSDWLAQYTSILMLIISSVYSAAQLPLLQQRNKRDVPCEGNV